MYSNIIITYIVVLKVSRKNKDYAKLLATNNPIKHRSLGSIVYTKESDPWLDFDNVDVLELIELMIYIDNTNKKNKIFEVKIRNNNEYIIRRKKFGRGESYKKNTGHVINLELNDNGELIQTQTEPDKRTPGRFF
eukprot:gene11472-4636_t